MKLWAGVLLFSIIGLGTTAAWSIETNARAQMILNASQVKTGLCVQLECTDTDIQVLAALVRSGRFLAHATSSDPTYVAAARKKLAQSPPSDLAGLISIECLPSTTLPYADHLVDLLMADDVAGLLAKGITLKEMLRVLSPQGVACLGVKLDQAEKIKAALTQAGVKTIRLVKGEQPCLVFSKPRSPKLDDWSHVNHGPDGNPVSRDQVVATPNQLQWIAGPSWGTGRYSKSAASAGPSGVLSAGGRNYYVQGSNLVVRDAFNGVIHWMQKMPGINTRRMVASGNELFLVKDGALVALEGATGKVARTYAEKVKLGQLLIDGDTLFVISNGIKAYDIKTATEKWSVTQRVSRALASDGHLYFAPQSGFLACVKQADGKAVWKRDVSSEVGAKAGMSFVSNGIVLMRSGNQFFVLSATDGQLLWKGASNKGKALAYLAGGHLWIENTGAQPQEGLGYPKIKTGSEIISKWIGYEPQTGKVVRTISGPPNIKYRCHTLYATDRFMVGNRPIYFTSWKDGKTFCFEGTRAQCGSAYALAQGMFYGLYTNSQKCMCMSTAISGTTAFASDPRNYKGETAEVEKDRLIKGSASAPEPKPVSENDWPMYRRDPLRSSCAPGTVASKPTLAWEQSLLTVPSNPSVIQKDWDLTKPNGDALTAPTIAYGKVFVGLRQAHRVVALDEANGKVVWTFDTGGRVDAPPTLYQGLCLFGSHDGWVYAVRADNGHEVWRFRAAPAQRRMVAYGQVTSTWPVVGGVLLANKTAYVIAGHSTETDGGLYIHALNPLTGEKKWSGRRYKRDPKIFGGYTPRRGTTYVGSVDLLCSDGKTISIAGCARGRFDAKTGKNLTYRDQGLAFGWVPTRYYRDQYGTTTVPVAWLKKTRIAVNAKTRAIQKHSKTGWKTAFGNKPTRVESLVVTSGAEAAGQGGKAFHLPTVQAKSIESAPQIDGVIEKAYAQLSAPLAFSFLNNNAGTPREATTAWALSDSNNLYLAFRCAKADPEKVLCKKTERDGNVWEDECIEIFLNPTNSRSAPYYHIIINAAGVTEEIYGKDKSWNPNLTVAAGKEAGKAWTMEIKIPFKELSKHKGSPGQVWSMNLNRSARNPNNKNQVEDTAWSPTHDKSSHVPEMFGYLWVDALKANGADYATWKKKLKPVVRRSSSDMMPRENEAKAQVVAALSDNARGQGGEIWVLSAKDGKQQGTFKLKAPPTHDGLAVAHGKIFVTLQNGSVVCLGAE